jgi:hypothetical protein
MLHPITKKLFSNPIDENLFAEVPEVGQQLCPYKVSELSPGPSNCLQTINLLNRNHRENASPYLNPSFRHRA